MHVTFTAETKPIVLPKNVLHKHPCRSRRKQAFREMDGRTGVPCQPGNTTQAVFRIPDCPFFPKPKELQWQGSSGLIRQKEPVLVKF